MAVLIFHPSKTYGGTEKLFYEFYVYCKNQNIDVKYCDYSNGVIFKQLQLSDRIIYKEEDTNIPTRYTLVATADVFVKHKINNLNNKISLWVTHKWQLLNYARTTRIVKYLGYTDLVRRVMLHLNMRILIKIDKLITYLLRYDSLIFFSLMTYQKTSEVFDIPQKSKVVNLPYRPQLINKGARNILSNKSISFGWLGRLDKDMIGILHNIIWLLSAISSHTQKIYILHVIGSGNMAHKIKEGWINKKLHIIKYRSMEYTNALEFMNNNVDIGIGRGIVQLDCCSLGIPFIRADINIRKKLLRKQFQYGFQDEDDRLDKYPLETMIKDSVENYRELSLKSLKYIREKHDYNTQMATLLYSVKCAKAKTKDILKMI